MAKPVAHNALKDLVALVTGGGTGIGREIALTFAREGARVAITGRRKEPLKSVAQEIEMNGGQAHAIAGDVSKGPDCQRMVRDAVKHFGALHILVNNAGIASFGRVDEQSDADIQSLVDVNLTGAMLMSKYALPELLKHKDSGVVSVLNISSSAALSGVRNFSVYSAAKAGLIHFTKCLALDLAAEHVRVNCITPGVVKTPIHEGPGVNLPELMAHFAESTPLGRVGQPADIAEAALYLSGKKAAWITGSVLTVDGGISLA
jgi:NAD(P)-dependent dehydrogenase (short-subunit alcohol dehydrogenase family)